jgi:ATP-binding cassette, subfamily B, multidrug efflux pump
MFQKLTHFLSENLSGIKVTQIFNQEDKKLKSLTNVVQNLKKSYLQEIMVFGIYRPIVYALSMVGICYYPLGRLSRSISSSYYSRDSCLVIIMYVGDFFQPIQQLAEQFNSLQNAFASAEKIFDVLDTKPDIVDDPKMRLN